MTSGRKTPPETLDRIKKLLQEGELSQAQISARMGVSKRTVSRVAKETK